MSIKRFIKQSILDAKAYRPPVDRKDRMKLDLNENYSVINESLLQQLKDFDVFTVSAYPEYQALLPLVSRYAQVPLECVSLMNGSDHGIQLLIDLFFKEGDTVVIPSPTFFVYYHFLNIKQVVVKEVLYHEEDGHYNFPIEETLQSLDRDTTGLILCDPNNPLGVSIPESELVLLLKKTNELDVPIIIDEAYFEYSNGDATKYLSEYKNLIILRTFSKAFGMSGLRLGYVLADSEIIVELEKLRLAWSVNHFAVHAGIVALREVSYFKKKIQEQKRIKDDLYALLVSRGLHCYKTETNFLICKHPNYLHIIARLNEKGILVNNVAHYPYSGELLKNAFRINVPSENDLEVLRKIVF